MTLAHLEKNRSLGSASMLVGKQRLLGVFVVDAGANGAWTEDSRARVEHQLASALRWLESQAAAHNVALEFEHACAPAEASACTCSTRIDEQDPASGPHHSGWQNQVVTDLLGASNSVSSAWNSLFERNGLGTPVTAGRSVLFFVRRWHPSIAFPFHRGAHPDFEKERGIIYDMGGLQDGQPHLDSQIAHEILHLYGAIDLAEEKLPAETPELRRAILANTAPQEVMNKPTQAPIASYLVGDLTSYLVGWLDRPPNWLLASMASA